MTENSLIYSEYLKPQVVKQQKYRYFSKSFRAELQFIEAVINYDQTIKYEGCFSCFHSDPNKDHLEQLAQKYNPQFYIAFKTMTPQQRENYQQQLKYLIHLLQQQITQQCKRQAKQHQARQAQNNQITLQQWMRHRVQKRIKNNLIKIILPENFQTAIMKNMMLESFELKVMIQGKPSEKMVKFDYFFMHLVSTTKKNQSKIILGVRNYILMSSNKKGYTHHMQSIYSTIQPQSIHLQFHNDQQKHMIVNYLEWVIKIGKVENLIRNYEIEKKLQIIVKQVDSKQKNGIYSTVFQRTFSFDGTERDSDSDDDISKISLYQSQNFIYNQTRNKQMRQKIYKDMKKKLIVTLKQIAEKKNKQNEIINQFLNRHQKIGPKIKSDAILSSLKDPENVLVDLNFRKIVKIFEMSLQQKKDSNQEVNILEKILQIPKNENLKVISSQIDDKIEKSEVKSYVDDQVEDSFLSKNNYERQKHKNNEVKSILSTFIKYQPDIYSTVFYKDRKIKSDENLSGYKKILISKDMYIVSELKSQTTQQSTKLKDKTQTEKIFQSDFQRTSQWKKRENRKSSDKLNKIKIQSNEKHQSLAKVQKTFRLQKIFEIINRQCSLLQKKNKHNSLKVFIKQPLQLRYLLSVMADVTTWHQWHPNINSAKLLSQNKQQNICEFELKCKVAKHQFQYKVMAHFFHVEDRYYLVMKTLPKEDNKNSVSFWKTLKFWKKDQDVKIDYLLIKMHKSSNDITSKLAVDFQINQESYTKNLKIVPEQATFFLNFYFAHQYWKTIKNKIDSLPHEIQKQFKVQKGKKLFNDSLLRIDWAVDSSMMQSKQHHWNKLNGQPL